MSARSRVQRGFRCSAVSLLPSSGIFNSLELSSSGLLLTGIMFAEGERFRNCTQFIDVQPSFEAILMIRTWAVWKRDWRFGVLFFGLLIGSTVVSSVNISGYLKALRCTSYCVYVSLFDFSAFLDGPPLYPGFRGCIVTNFSESLLAQFIILTSVDGGMRFCFYDL